MAHALRLRSIPIVAAILAVAGAALLPAPVRACSCTIDPDFAMAYAQSHTIFVGEVLGIRPHESGFEEVWVLLSVEGWWKGAPATTTLEVRTGANDGVCGVGFMVGEKWLVYALNSAGGLWTHSCWRSHYWYADDPDLAALGPVPVRATSWGRVKISYR